MSSWDINIGVQPGKDLVSSLGVQPSKDLVSSLDRSLGVEPGKDMVSSWDRNIVCLSLPHRVDHLSALDRNIGILHDRETIEVSSWDRNIGILHDRETIEVSSWGRNSLGKRKWTGDKQTTTKTCNNEENIGNTSRIEEKVD